MMKENSSLADDGQHLPTTNGWQPDPADLKRLASADARVAHVESILRRLKKDRKRITAGMAMKRLHADPGFHARREAARQRARMDPVIGPRWLANNAESRRELPPMSDAQAKLYRKLRPLLGRAAAVAEVTR